jgi:hypothetical protein
MSINFHDPLNNEALMALREMAIPVQNDERTFLFDRLEIDQRKMKELVNKAGQPATVEFNGDGDIKTMSDGTKYQCTIKGWVRVA